MYTNFYSSLFKFLIKAPDICASNPLTHPYRQYTSRDELVHRDSNYLTRPLYVYLTFVAKWLISAHLQTVLNISYVPKCI